MKNIFVSNLSFRINDEDLKQAFAEYGNIRSAKVIIDKLSGRSRGFGFVEMESDEDALRAISELNNADFDGKIIKVSEARPNTENRSGGGNRGFSRDNRGGGYEDRNRGEGFKKRY
jgi:RNA recognition motif-containing protein